MKAHPFADVFPLLAPTDLVAPANDIKDHGLHEPIRVFEQNQKRIWLKRSDIEELISRSTERRP